MSAVATESGLSNHYTIGQLVSYNSGHLLRHLYRYLLPVVSRGSRLSPLGNLIYSTSVD